MKWKKPPIIKIYEALGAVADGRIEVTGDTANVYSSSGNKFYTVAYDPVSGSIMANDNGSYWKGYLGYPAIAYLFAIGVLEYRNSAGELLKGIRWKDINQQFKNDFDRTLDFIHSNLSDEQKKSLQEYVTEVDNRLTLLDLNLLGSRQLPPKGY